MSFDWADFLTLADALVHDPNLPGPEEACLRTAISRAYYAAFRVARNFGWDRGEFTPTETGQDHWLVMNHFRSSPDRIRRKIGLDLDRLYDNRTSADYDDVLAGRPIALVHDGVNPSSVHARQGSPNPGLARRKPAMKRQKTALQTGKATAGCTRSPWSK